jgi:transcription elongation GreA/GreB family factor
MGDLSENGAYTAAKSELRDTDRRLRHLNRLLKWGVVIKSKNKDKIEFDSKVTLDTGSSKLDIHLVSGFEADPLKGKISVYSPLGKALLGKSKENKVTVTTPNGELIYTILAITI